MVGTRVAFDVNDAGRIALGGTMGPAITQIEGRLVQQDSGDYVVAVSSVHLMRGDEQSWTGEQVRIKPEYVSTVYERRFDRGRSIAMGAAGIGAVAVLVTRSILGAGSGDARATPPTDSSHTALRARRP